MAKTKSPRPVIGIIGGIGSGKSLVASMLGEFGCEVIDADRIGHALLERPEIIAALRRRFGDDIVGPDGRVDRHTLGHRAFADGDAHAALNAIMHPPLRAELVRRVEAFRAGRAPAAVIDAALLLETDWHELCDVLVFVEAPAKLRRERLAAVRGWSAERLAQREICQKPLDFKRHSSHHVLENNSSVSHLRERVRQVYQRIVSQ